MHPAIEREKAATATAPPAASDVKPMGAVAATKTTSAKQTSTPQGYPVTDGSRKGRVIGHDGAMNKVKWDDGSTSMVQGNEVRDTSENVLRSIVREILNATDTQFVWETFEKIAREGTAEFGSDLDGRMDAITDYAHSRLEKLGEGTGRAVYALNSHVVLKVSLNGAGRKQSKIEIDVSARARAGDPIAPVLSFDPKFMWIKAERADPLYTDQDFENVFGVSVEDALQAVLTHDKSSRVQVVRDSLLLIDRFGLDPRDVVKPENWGTLRGSGRPVLIDYGLTS
jgi:hypothetical protein